MDVALRFRPADGKLMQVAASTPKSIAGSVQTLSDAQQKASASIAFDENASQEDISSVLVEPELVRLIRDPGSAFVCIAYGQTGSGKTHSIFGPPGLLTEDAASQGIIPDAWGVFPRSIAMMLQELDRASISVDNHKPAAKRAQLRVTAVEVYLDRVYDLLNDREPIAIAGTSQKATSKRMNNNNVVRDEKGKWVPPDTWKTVNDERKEREQKASKEGRRETSTSGNDLQATNSKEVIVTSMHDIANVARTIEATRSAKSHSLNERSSRSHCLITITLQQVRNEMVCSSYLVFADLAGSERVSDSGVDADGGGKAKAYALCNGIRVDLGGTRLDEARSVNTSLSSLGRVVAAMSRNDKFISFRDSALTQLLKPALTSPASCHITVLLALRSEPQYSAESLSTQRFGAVCANAASGAGPRSGPRAGSNSPRLPRISDGGKPSAKSMRSSEAKVSGSSSAGVGKGVRLQIALALATSGLQEAETDILQMQRDGFDEHPVQPCSEFPASTIRTFLKNKQQFDDGAVEVRKWKHTVMELRAKAKASNEDLSSEIKRGEEHLSAAEHAVFVYSGLFYRQASTGIWIPRHKRLTARMSDRDTLQMQVAFLSGSPGTHV